MSTNRIVPSVDALRFLRRITSSRTETASRHKRHASYRVIARARTNDESATGIKPAPRRPSSSPDRSSEPILVKWLPRNTKHDSSEQPGFASVAPEGILPYESEPTQTQQIASETLEKANDDQNSFPQPERLTDWLKLVPLPSTKYSSRASSLVTIESLPDKLLEVRVRPGGAKQFKKLYSSILVKYLSPGPDRRPLFLRALHFKLKEHVKEVELIGAQHTALETLLSSKPPAEDAIKMLVWGFASRGRLYRRHAQRRCVAYLLYYVRKYPDNPGRQRVMATKVINGLNSIGASPSTDVILPVIKGVLAAGQTEKAYKFIVHAHDRLGLRHSLNALLEIVLKRARDGDWGYIDQMLHDLHLQGFSRSMPWSFAALAETALTCIMSTRQESYFYDYLTFCMQYHGLVPTHTISAIVYEQCIKTSRVDTALAWNTTLARDWPLIVGTCRSSDVAHRLAKQWARSESSCTSILLMLKAMAYGAVRNPFGQELRLLAKDAICQDLARRLRSLPKLPGGFLPDLDPDRAASGTDFVDKVVEATRDVYRWRIKHVGFRKQIVSAREAMLLLDDFDTYVDVYGTEFTVPPMINTQSYDMRPSMQLRKANRMWLAVPDVPGLLEKIESEYAREEAAGNPADSTILRQALDALQSMYRFIDMATLLSKLASTSRAQDIFDSDNYITWLQIVPKVRSNGPETYLDILKALIFTTPNLKLSDQLIMMIAKTDLLLNRYRRPPYMRLAPRIEPKKVNALKDILYRRKWSQKGCPSADDIEEPNLRAWKQSQAIALLPAVRESSRRARVFGTSREEE